MNTTPRPNKTRKITLAATAALLATMSLASCTTPGSAGQSTTTIPSSVPAGTDGTLTPTKAKTGFAVSENKTEVIMAISAISATLTPTGDTSWDLTLKGVDDTMARTGPADSARVQTTTFFDDPSNLTVRLGTANSVLSGDVAGTGASDLIMAVSTPTLNKDNTATLQASSVPTGEIGRALARSGGITITAEGQTTKEINTLPTASTDTITVNNATLYISAGGTEVIDDCAIVPDANCENADLFQSNLVGANLQGANLQGANLAMSTLRNANFDDANLDTAQLFRSDLTNSTWIDATLDEATLEQSTLVDANLTGVSAKRVNLFRSELKGINLNDSNFTDSNLAANRPLPPVFLGKASTQMRCVESTLGAVHDHGYAHHIQRLMILGNLCLLAGVRPGELVEWMWASFVDGAEWVMLPNVLGMALYADGGLMATKPYASGGAYIDKMSDYCKDCVYDRKKRTGEDACPFTTLYWDFLARHEYKIARNPRVAQQVRAAHRLSDLDDVRVRAVQVLLRLDRGEL